MATAASASAVSSAASSSSGNSSIANLFPSFASAPTSLGRQLAFLLLALGLGAPLLTGLIRVVRRRNEFVVDGKTALLTGASEGMGKAVAEQLAAKGANVVIVARTVAKLELAMRDIKKAARDPTSQRFLSIAADVTSAAEIARVLAETRDFNGGHSPDVVWCIAGAAFPRLYLDTRMDEIRRLMDLNFFAGAEMAQAVLKDWLRPAEGGDAAMRGSKSGAAPPARPRKHLIFTSSVAGFFSVAGYAGYAPGKAALRTLGDTLAQEVQLYTTAGLAAHDVRVHTVIPGGIDSPGMVTENLSKPAITRELERDDPVQAPGTVAARAIAGLERGHPLVCVHWLGDLMRASVLGGSPRNSWWADPLRILLTVIIWPVVAWDLTAKVRRYARVHGHPSGYAKVGGT